MKSMIKKAMTAAAVGTVMTLGAGSAMAVETPVAGIYVSGPGDTTFEFTNITETFVGGVGDVLSGFGRVSQINSRFGNDICVSGACELTFTFDNYVVREFNTADDDNTVAFGGGLINFYVDETPDSDLSTISGFSDGDLWMTLTGRETTAVIGPNAGQTGTLFGTGNQFSDSELVNGTGIGELNVSGGAAASYFGLGTLVNLTSSFQPSIDGWALPVSGNANLTLVAAETPPTEVPEPATLALLGMGLLGLGAASRSRKHG
ncbi:PEP-CTERM sorting domain-containing protein [Skermanella stibiiresistens]|nr:PEP-CTERM sorting domain-containing protein [Skermanella stibiiresistens]